MIKVKTRNAHNSRAIAKFRNAEIDYFRPKLIVHELLRGSLLKQLYKNSVHIIEIIKMELKNDIEK